MNTVQLSLQDSNEPELEPKPEQELRAIKERKPKSQSMECKKSIRVIVRGRKCSEIDSLGDHFGNGACQKRQTITPEPMHGCVYYLVPEGSK